MLRPLTVCTLLFLTPVLMSAGETWKQSLARNGITIHTRQVPGSAFKEFRATMTVDTTLARATVIMENVPGYTQWMKDCKEARLLKKLSATSGIIYSLQSAPWPIAEREAVVRYTLKKMTSPQALLVRIAAEPSTLPATPGKVRISTLSGYWEFLEVAPHKLRVTYALHSEPGGSLPQWAVAGMIAHLPYETLSRLRQILEAK
jgi:hypothetical protein